MISIKVDVAKRYKLGCPIVVDVAIGSLFCEYGCEYRSKWTEDEINCIADEKINALIDVMKKITITKG